MLICHLSIRKHKHLLWSYLIALFCSGWFKGILRSCQGQKSSLLESHIKYIHLPTLFFVAHVPRSTKFSEKNEQNCKTRRKNGVENWWWLKILKKNICKINQNLSEIYSAASWHWNIPPLPQNWLDIWNQRYKVDPGKPCISRVLTTSTYMFHNPGYPFLRSLIRVIFHLKLRGVHLVGR